MEHSVASVDILSEYSSKDTTIDINEEEVNYEIYSEMELEKYFEELEVKLNEKSK